MVRRSRLMASSGRPRPDRLVRVRIAEEKLQEMAKEVMENYPEYSSPSLRCTSWKYDAGIFKFLDTDSGKEYTVTTAQVAKAIPSFIEKNLSGKYNLFRGLDSVAVMDTGNWDADAVDGLVQETIFGDVIYG